MNRCLIPAAGVGTRMAPATLAVPKALLPVGTRPLVQWCITEALEGGFDEIAVVTDGRSEALEAYLKSGVWREGLPAGVLAKAHEVEIERFHQPEPRGVVDAVLAADRWIESDATFAVFLPDNVRLSGGPILTARHLSEAAEEDVTLIGCHRVGPESSRYYGNVGRASLEVLVPAGARPRVVELQERGPESFRAPPEGAWRLTPRYVVTSSWMEEAERLARTGEEAGDEADDVSIHRKLAEDGRLVAVPWEGTLVDAGRPAGYLYANHLLHRANSRERDASPSGAGLLHIEI